MRSGESGQPLRNAPPGWMDRLGGRVLSRSPSMGPTVAALDLGSNSTRLLIARRGDDGALIELERRSTVTRLGDGLEASGRLADDAVDRVVAVLARYRELIDAHEATATGAVLTSAVRDAANGPAFTARVRDEFALDARTISGDEEATLTFAGATTDDRGPGRTLVIDVGGGSTELVFGAAGGAVDFHVSTQVGVVRHGERHLVGDPPGAAEVAALKRDAASTFAAAVPHDRRAPIDHAIAVGGTPSMCAAMLGTTTLRRSALGPLRDALATLTLARRAQRPGLDPARAPTIVAGITLLLAAMDVLALDTIVASDRDILHGIAARLLGGESQLETDQG
jgi:exopolyphosphatase/guanosine-5'-triphosphate,3'-diphosphate pyrophosphatase